jgi:hypothetical protein
MLSEHAKNEYNLSQIESHGQVPKQRVKYVKTANRVKELPATYNPKMPKKALTSYLNSVAFNVNID